MPELEDLYSQFPRLRDSQHQITSPCDDRYNCVAWVIDDRGRWWEPGFWWPAEPPKEYEPDLDCYVEMFRGQGFEVCADGAYEAEYLKIALYAEGGDFHHVAMLLPSRHWSSKAGPLHDLKHRDLAALEGSGILRLAEVAVYMRRPRDNDDPMELEETGLIRPR